MSLRQQLRQCFSDLDFLRSVDIDDMIGILVGYCGETAELGGSERSPVESVRLSTYIEDRFGEEGNEGSGGNLSMNCVI